MPHPPDPDTAADPAGFVALLGELRDWAGRPSLRTLRSLGGTTTAPGGETVDALPTSTISYVLLGRRLPGLPRRSFVRAYVTACLTAADHPADQVPAVVTAWLDTWRGLRGGTPAGPARTPALARTPARPAPPPTSLPRDIGDFTGREPELAAILAALREDTGAARIVTVDGMAGVGKTTLAVHAAHRLAADFPDGRFLVDMHGHGPDRPPRDPLDGLGVLLRATGDAPGTVPVTLDDAVTAWRGRTAGLRVLIVLDDCLDVTRIAPLLPTGPGCGVLVTGRNRLPGLDGATPVSLGVFTRSEAAALLTRLAGEERVRAEPDAAAHLIDHVGALALGVRLIGARLRHRPVWPLSALLTRLSDGGGDLGRLGDGDRSVAAAFASSYRALTPAVRRTFRLLAVHREPIGAGAAAALAGLTRVEAEEHLETLTDAHMVEQPVPGRYETHDLLAAYAAQRSAAEDTDGERRTAVGDALAWYLHTSLAGARLLDPRSRTFDPVGEPAEPLAFGDRGEAIAWFETERTALVAAVHTAAETGADAAAWQLAVSLSAFFEARGYNTDRLDVLSTALPCAGDDYARAWVLGLLGIAHRAVHRYDDAVAAWEEALAIRIRIGDEYGEALAHNNLGAGFAALGRADDAMHAFRRALDLAREAGDTRLQGTLLSNIADLHHAAGRFADAVEHAAAARDLARDTGNLRGEGIAAHNLGRALAGAGRAADAVTAYDAALLVLRDLGERWGVAATQHFRGESLRDLGRHEDARAAWREALDLFGAIGDPAAETVAELLRRSPGGREPGPRRPA